MRSTHASIALALVAISVAPLAPARAAAPLASAWERLERDHPAAAKRFTNEERRVLRLLAWEQALAWLDGLDPAHVALPDGRSLASVLGVGFDLSWWTVDAGGGRSAAGGFALTGTLGQPDPGALAGGGYRLAGGFWPSAVDTDIFADDFESGDTTRWSAAVPEVP